MEKIRCLDIVSVKDFLSKDPMTLLTTLGGDPMTDTLRKLREKATQMQERYDRKFAHLFEPLSQEALIPSPRKPITLFESERQAWNKVETQILSHLNEAVALGELTEVAGFPGLGKTTLCIQLARNFVRQYEREGFEAMIYDCEGGIIASRLLSLFGGNRSQMNKVFIRRVTTTSEFEELRLGLKKFLKQNRMLRLIVIDSIASHFRLGKDAKAFDVGPEAHDMGNALRRLARHLDVAIIITHPCASDSSRLAPRLVLGDAFSAQAATRLSIINQRKGRMVLNVEKTPIPLHLPDAPLWAGEVGFVLTEDGLTPHLV